MTFREDEGDQLLWGRGALDSRFLSYGSTLLDDGTPFEEDERAVCDDMRLILYRILVALMDRGSRDSCEVFEFWKFTA